MKSTWKPISILIVTLTVILGIMMAAFSLPAVHSGINDLPIGIISSNSNYKSISKPLEDKGFNVSKYKDVKDVKSNINKRKIYGAIEIDKNGNVNVYKATAASASVAQVLTQMGTQLVNKQQALGRQVINQNLAKTNNVNIIKVLNQKLAALDKKQANVVEVKSFPKSDPKGAGLAAGALPIALGGWIGAVAISLFIKGKKEKLLSVIGFAIVGGLGLVGVIQFGIGTFNGNYLLTSMGAMLGIGATGMFVLGILEVMGNAGLGIAAVILILLGNPLSGLTSAPEMLPNGWGELGQLLPPGATGTLLRNIVFFHSNDIVQAVSVLSCYVLLGLILFAVGKKSNIVKA